MDYGCLVQTYKAAEETRKRLELTDILTKLFKETPKELIQEVVYLTQGRLYPDFIGLELGLADKLVQSVLAATSGLSVKEVETLARKTGDLGDVAFEATSRKRQNVLFHEPLTVERVYSTFETIARASGPGSQDKKRDLLANLVHDSSPEEARYIVRMVLGRLRLGIADATIIDALASAFAAKEERDRVERAYNVTSDLGLVGKTLAGRGLAGLDELTLKIGVPIRPMLAERLGSIREILEKMGGKAALEYKYDGIRVQIHYDSGRVRLFSRQLEEITSQYPDIVEAVMGAVKVKTAVLDGEGVPIDASTGEMLPFQEVSHRRGRKHGVADATKDFPVVVFLFDCLLVDGMDLTSSDYSTRRAALAEAVRAIDRVALAEQVVVDSEKDGEEFFSRALGAGCEGIVAKTVASGGTYKAGARGWLWIKYKREYKSEMTDTADLVVVGAFSGRGRRAGRYGALLGAAYNPDDDAYETVCKVGTGFDDSTLAEIPKMLEPYKVPRVHRKVRSKMRCEINFEPAVVMEVAGAELTLSPVHTCAFGLVREGSGLAIRFPRFTGRWRTDEKSPEDATTTLELLKMYQSQRKKVG